MSIYDAIAFMAHELFTDEFKGLAPHTAIGELVRWAEANEPLPGGKLKAVRRQLKDIWNSVLPPALPSRSIVHLIKSIYPLQDPEERWSDKRVVEIRCACLRLLCRVLAQVDSWEDDLVEVPSQWFRQKKDLEDPKSIVGVSTETYRKSLIVPLEDAGVLTLETEGNRLEHTCAQYRIHIERDGEGLTLQEAETLLKR